MPTKGTIKLELLTAADSKNEKIELSKQFDELKQNLENDNIIFSYSLGKNMHDRWILSDTGWKIILSRGLDFIHKPDAKLSIGAADQTKRACKATTITFIKSL